MPTVRKRAPTKTSGQGRPAGVPNKITRDIREMILGALSEVGGQKWLVKQAELNPTAFMSLLGKMIPTQIDAPIKRELPEMTRDELLALLDSARAASRRAAAPAPGADHPSFHSRTGRDPKNSVRTVTAV